jgi:NADH dehydrogenase FAD-containing subunit
MEKPFKLKFNLGSWSFRQSFRRNSFRKLRTEKEWPNAFNKVIHTENIFAIGDTCIQLTDMEFPTVIRKYTVAIQQGINLAENFNE